MSPEELQFLEQNYQARRAKRLASQPQPQRGRGGWKTSLISEGGALGGAAAGAAIGSVVPILGTAIGGAIGAGVGAFGGRLAENKVRDNRLGFGDAAKEGALSAVLSAPLKIGKYGLSAGKALKGGATLEKALITGADDAAKFTLRGLAGNKAGEVGKNLAIRPLGLAKGQKTAVRTLGQGSVADIAERFGITSYDDIGKSIANANTRYGEILDSIPAIPKTAIQDSLQAELKKLATSKSTQNKAVAKSLKAEIDNILKQLPDTIDGQTMNQIKREFDSLVTPAQQLANPAIHSINKRIADGLRKGVQAASGSDELRTLGLDTRALKKLEAVAAKNLEGGTGKSGMRLTDIAATTAALASGNPLPIAGAVGARLASGPTAARVTSSAFKQGGERLAESSAKAATMRGNIMNGARNRALVSSVGAGLGADQSQDSQMSVTNPATIPNASQNSNVDILNEYAGGDNMSSQSAVDNSPFSQANLRTTIDQALAQGASIKDLKEIIAFAKDYNAIMNPATETAKPLSESQQGRADLQTALGNLEGIVANGSVNYGPISSRIESIKGTFNRADTETLSYKNAVGQVRGAIAKARAGASMTPGELKLLDTYTPKETDSEQVLMSKLQQLRALFGYESPQGGAASIEDALSQLR